MSQNTGKTSNLGLLLSMQREILEYQQTEVKNESL